jgi:methylenetetrahydrofolate--tRNA-(uracil-5-)-methyltransferase
MKIKIIGAGLAGSEAAWQIAESGIKVELIEMRPKNTTKAHKTSDFAELVCSNSLRGADLTNAVGLLKEELKLSGSLIMEAAIACQVPAGSALAVDRNLFSKFITDKILTHPNISVACDEITSIPTASISEPVIISTGPLTSRSLSLAIEDFLGCKSLAFFDAVSPILLDSSLDKNYMFFQSRYDKGSGADYLNIPLNQEQYTAFIEDVSKAEKYGGNQDVENDSLDQLRPFEGCMPIEDMIARGLDTLRFGPFKPTGLRDPKTGKRPFAVMQLRQDDKEASLWSLVGMQTRMKRAEQERIFKSLPGMQEAEFVRFGSVHRNTFIDSPKFISPSLECKKQPGLFFAGQITGVEGYVESTAAGLVAGLNAARLIKKADPIIFPTNTAIGALIAYISDPSRINFQPMNISYGLMPSYAALQNEAQNSKKKANKKDLRLSIANEAIRTMKTMFKLKESPDCKTLQYVNE